MADNTTRTPGVGETIAADDISSVKYQRVKVTLGADGTNSGDLDGTTTRGARVDPFGTTLRVQQTPTISSGAAYASGDQLGPIMTIAGAARFTGGGGTLTSVVVMCKANVAPTMVLRFYDRSVTVAADNAPATTSDTDETFLVGGLIIAAGNYLTVYPGTPPNQSAQIPAPTGATTSVGLVLPYVCDATSLFCSAQITSATTFTSTSDLVFSFTFAPD